MAVALCHYNRKCLCGNQEDVLPFHTRPLLMTREASSRFVDARLEHNDTEAANPLDS
jgi:hypothetical protein